MKKLILIFLILAIYFPSSAFNSRAGELTYRCTGGMTYEFDMKIWGETFSASDSICLDFGDNSFEYLTGSDVYTNVSLAPILPSNYSNVQQVTWRTTHSYTGAGVYTLYLSCINRISGITNIPNSIATSLQLRYEFLIDPSVGCNSAPVDMNNVHMVFPALSQSNMYALNYIDPDGDSLSFSFEVCNEPGYNLPDNVGGGSLIMNPSTGQFSWNGPLIPGVYNVIIKTQQWRHFSNNVTVFLGESEREIEFVVDNANGINQEAVGNELNVFPNPVNSSITFQSGKTIHSEIIITDQLGRIVHHEKSSGEKQFEISVVDLTDGMYFYEYINNSGRKASGKFIVKH